MNYAATKSQRRAFQAFRSILKRFKMERNARAIVSMLPLDAFCCDLLRWRQSIVISVTRMPSRFHDGVRRSRLPDREAARRRRGLDGRHRRRDQDCGGTTSVFMRLVATLIADSARQQLQCVGCGGQRYWPFGGTSCGPVWPRVVLVGRVGI
jgi:hypothetical protein